MQQLDRCFQTAFVVVCLLLLAVSNLYEAEEEEEVSFAPAAGNTLFHLRGKIYHQAISTGFLIGSNL